MSYALFAQRKVVLTGNINSVSLQQTQRSNEQYALASQTLSLQQKMTSLQSAQAGELANLYALLSRTQGTDSNGAEQRGINFDGADSEERSRLNNTLRSLGFNSSSVTRNNIEAAIKAKEQENQRELDKINREIYVVSIKENALEMQVKNLDTKLSSLQKQLEAVEEAESSAIDRATPKFNGVG